MGDIGKKIRELREAQGMTQEELAHKVGYKSRVSINKIELQRDIPLKKASAIATALGITPAELVGWDEEPVHREYSMQTAEEDFELLTKYAKLSKEDKKIIMDMIDSLLKKSPNTQESEKINP